MVDPADTAVAAEDADEEEAVDEAAADEAKAVAKTTSEAVKSDPAAAAAAVGKLVRSQLSQSGHHYPGEARAAFPAWTADRGLLDFRSRRAHRISVSQYFLMKKRNGITSIQRKSADAD